MNECSRLRLLKPTAIRKVETFDQKESHMLIIHGLVMVTHGRIRSEDVDERQQRIEQYDYRYHRDLYEVRTAFQQFVDFAVPQCRQLLLATWVGDELHPQQRTSTTQ